MSVISAGTVRIHPEHLHRTRKPLYFDIAALGYTPVDVDTAIVSHLHVDHLAELAKPVPGLRGLLRSHIQVPGLTWHQVSLEPTDNPGTVVLSAHDSSSCLLERFGGSTQWIRIRAATAGNPPLLLVQMARVCR